MTLISSEVTSVTAVAIKVAPCALLESSGVLFPPIAPIFKKNYSNSGTSPKLTAYTVSSPGHKREGRLRQ